MRSCFILPVGLFALSHLLAGAAGAAPNFNDMFGAWSPDGRQIAFASDRTGDFEIYVANVDGSGLRRLTSSPGRDAHPAWSPDGRRIVFQSPRHNGHTRIFDMRPDGESQEVLARTMGFCGVPAWSPDGSRLAFQCSPATVGFGQGDAPWRIYLMHSDGSHLRAITHGPGNDQVPSWSPDAAKILFFSDRTGTDQLYEYEVISGRIERLTDGDPHRSASYSPDGRRIAMMTGPASGQADMHVLERRSGAVSRITTSGPHLGTPSFSPDGHLLLFQAPTDSGWRLHVTRVGSGIVQPLQFRQDAEDAAAAAH